MGKRVKITLKVKLQQLVLHFKKYKLTYFEGAMDGVWMSMPNSSRPGSSLRVLLSRTTPRCKTKPEAKSFTALKMEAPTLLLPTSMFILK